ncbi:MAG: arylsulfatase [Candidatus Omnitrophica bacterium]|nr:arylsulfatase [Candidatus Omnitrophota bacterium]
MKRRDFMKTAALSAGALSINRFLYADSPEAQRPNIVFVLADDLGYGDLGCYGQKYVKTPNLDRMAAEGMKFTQFYSGSTVCAPSRCCLMTGLHTGHAFIRGNKEIQPEGQYPIPPDTITIAKVLQKAGYKTGCIGKWGLGGPGSSGAPNQQGFDYWYGYLCQRQAHRYYPSHLWENEAKIELNGEKYSHDLMTEKAMQFLDENHKNPFFLYIPYTIPHAELVVPEDSMKEYEGRFEEKPFGGAGNYGAQPSPKAAFAGMGSRLDRDMGRLLNKLKELGIDDHTVVLFSSDNGPHKEGGHDPGFFDSNGPLRGIKRDLYEGGIRVPTIARWPGRISPGTVSDHIGAFWDMMPTFADLAGIEPPDGLDGVSFAPLLRGNAEKQKTHKFLYWEFHERGFNQAVRMGEWKAVKTAADKPLELYNLNQDIGETRNIAKQNPNIVKQIESYLSTVRVESEIFPTKKGE